MTRTTGNWSVHVLNCFALFSLYSGPVSRAGTLAKSATAPPGQGRHSVGCGGVCARTEWLLQSGVRCFRFSPTVLQVSHLVQQRCVPLMQGFDYADKKKKLPFGPLPWPTGLPAPGYVPKTNPLNGRWVTVTGGDAEFIKKSIASGMLGSAEASKIQADVDTKKTGGMFLRITQNGEVCTVDASVAKFARVSRTWKPGHYFYEPLESDSYLFGVWLLPEEYWKIGFLLGDAFKKMFPHPARCLA